MTRKSGPVCVSVINMKGGVGKTTVAALLGRHASMELGLKVLARILHEGWDLELGVWKKGRGIMAERKIEDVLRSIVRRYGFGKVSQSLWEMEPSIHRFEHSSDKSGRKSAKVAAPEYVAKMDVSPEKRPLLTELARRFDDKSFLPSIGDVRNFCQIYRIDEPASGARASAIPRIFRFIVTMETDDVRRILDEGTFSGPSRLGPLADAIRGRARLRAPTHSPEVRTPAPSSSLPAMEAISSPNSPKRRT